MRRVILLAPGMTGAFAALLKPVSPAVKAVFALMTVAALLAVSGCVGRGSALQAWKRVDAGNTRYAGKLGFIADLPARWAVMEDVPAGTLLLTRHSVPLDFVQIKRHTLPARLPHTELTVRAGMHTYEIAEIVINNMRATPGVFDLTVRQVAPGGAEGGDIFGGLMSYAMENGMRRRCLIFGFIHSGGRYYTEIGLYALEEYYFGAVLEEFLTLVGSLTVED